jgi:hypothetical protein
MVRRSEDDQYVEILGDLGEPMLLMSADRKHVNAQGHPAPPEELVKGWP